jgi:hypothetical protein
VHPADGDAVEVAALPLTAWKRDAARYTSSSTSWATFLGLRGIADHLAAEAVARTGQPVIDGLERAAIADQGRLVGRAAPNHSAAVKGGYPRLREQRS